jgi:hypothetical protein
MATCSGETSPIVRILTLRSPDLTSDEAQDIAVVVLNNVKTMAALSDPADQSVRPGAIEELREMTKPDLKKLTEDTLISQRIRRHRTRQRRMIGLRQHRLGDCPRWYYRPRSFLSSLPAPMFDP